MLHLGGDQYNNTLSKVFAIAISNTPYHCLYVCHDL